MLIYFIDINGLQSRLGNWSIILLWGMGTGEDQLLVIRPQVSSRCGVHLPPHCYLRLFFRTCIGNPRFLPLASLIFHFVSVVLFVAGEVSIGSTLSRSIWLLLLLRVVRGGCSGSGGDCQLEGIEDSYGATA